MANHQKTEDEVRQFLDDVFMAIDAGRCTINIQPWSGNKVNKTRLYMTEKNLHLKDVCDVVKRLTVKNYSATKDDVNPNFHDELVWEFGIREIIVDTAEDLYIKIKKRVLDNENALFVMSFHPENPLREENKLKFPYNSDK